MMMFQHGTKSNHGIQKQSCERLRLIQSFLTEFESSETTNAKDAVLLVIPGIDGKYNKNSQRLMKYLFLGKTGLDLLEPTIDEDFEAIEDCFLCILKDGVKIFYGSEASSLVEKTIALWDDVEEFKLLKGEYGDDAELQERFKIQSLVDMLKPPTHIVLPTNDAEEENHELWPLVQAFGLDEFNTGGFLSATKTICHMGDEILDSLWSHIDNKDMFLESGEAQHLMKHWETSMRLISKQVREKASVDYSRESLFEPVDSFYELGSIRKSKYCNKVMDPANVSFSEDKSLINVKGVDPGNGISVMRTYFVNGEKQMKGELMEDLKQYGKLVKCYFEILKLVGQHPASGQKNHSYVEDHSRSRAEGRLKNLIAQQFDNDSSLEVKLISFDQSGRVIQPKELYGSNQKKHVELIHYLQVSYDNKFFIGDSFVIGNDRTPILLTSDALVFACWDLLGDHRFHIDDETSHSLGDIIENGGRRKLPVVMEFEGMKNFQLNANLFLFQHGFVIEHNVFGVLKIEFLDENSDDEEEEDYYYSSEEKGETKTTTARKSLVKKISSWYHPNSQATVATFLDQGFPSITCFLGKDVGKNYHVAIATFKTAELRDAIDTWEKKNQTVEFLDEHSPSSKSIYEKFDGSTLFPKDKFENKTQTQQKKKTLQQVFILVGSPGCGKSSIARAFNKHYDDSVIIENNYMVHGLTFSMARLKKQIANYQDETLIIVAPGDTSAEEIISAFDSEIKVSTVAVISAKYAYHDDRRAKLLPGIQTQCNSELTKTVIVTGSALVREYQLDELQNRISTWNAQAEIFCIGSSCQPSNCLVVGLEGEFWEQIEKVASTCSNKLVGSIIAHPHRHILESKIIFSEKMFLARNRFELGLERLTKPIKHEKFRNSQHENHDENVQLQKPQHMSLMDLESQGGGDVRVGLRKAQELAKQKVMAKQFSKYDSIDIQNLQIPSSTEIFGVYGHVSFEDNPRDIYSVSAINGTVKLEKITDVKEKQSLKSKSFSLMVVVAPGFTKSDKLVLEEYFTQLQAAPLLPVKNVSENTLSESQKQSINNALKNKPIPSGYWFDGRNYMDHTGVPLKYHPLFNDRLRNWIKEKNEQIDSHNKKVEIQQTERNQTTLKCI